MKMASAEVVEMSVTNNSPSQDSSHPDDHFQSRYVTPGFKPFSYYLSVVFPVAVSNVISMNFSKPKNETTHFRSWKYTNICTFQIIY